MKRNIVTIIGALALIPLLSPSIHAQGRPALEIRGGLNLPVGDFGDEGGVDAESEAGFGADIMVPIHQRLTLYAGAGREMFGCASCDDNDGFTSTGFEGGAKILLSRGEGAVLPWLKVGAIYHKAKFEFEGVEGESDWGLGIQLGGGVDIPLGEVLSFSPALRYQAYTASFEPFGLELESFEIDNDVSFLSLDMGLHIHFGHGG